MSFTKVTRLVLHSYKGFVSRTICNLYKSSVVYAFRVDWLSEWFYF
jgi:hypothetical protein